VGVLSVSKGKAPAWAVRGSSGAVEMLLSAGEIAAAGPAERALAGFDVRVSIIDPLLDIEPEIPRHAHVIVVEVRPALESSLRYLAKLRSGHPHARIVAAVHDPALPVVRALLRAGAHDVITLPLDPQELAATLAQIREDAAKGEAELVSRGRVVSVVKSVGGVGATALLTQTAALYSEREGHNGRETCLFDLDIQFGSAATYLGLAPAMGLRDLLEAGSRVDASMLRTTAARHSSGLDVFAAPADMMPLEAVDGDEICDLIDIAADEYDTVFVDLPGNWTNWSLSVVARSDLVLLVTELSIASLRQGRRVLDLIREQDLSEAKVQIVMNRVERKLFGSINLRDAATALRRPVSFTVTNDFWLMSTALDQGVMLAEVKAKNRIGRDLETLIQGIDTVLAERS
jgi:pilus assembly protein CpaE